MSRSLVVLAALGLALAPLTAFAAPSPSASPTAVAQDDRPRDGGVIEGRVTSVDYARGMISVDGPGGKVDVTTMPTTSVTSDDPGYHSLSDVSKGSRVKIFISRTAGKIVAQIIRLIKH
jgi:hypothetical protein